MKQKTIKRFTTICLVLASMVIINGCTFNKNNDSDAKKNNDTLIELKTEFQNVNKDLLKENITMTNERVLVPSSIDIEDDNAQITTYAIFTNESIKYDDNTFVNYSLSGERDERKYFYTFYTTSVDTTSESTLKNQDSAFLFNEEEMFTFLSIYISKEYDSVDNYTFGEIDNLQGESFNYGRYQIIATIKGEKIVFDEFVLASEGQNDVLVCIVESSETNAIVEPNIAQIILDVFADTTIKY